MRDDAVKYWAAGSGVEPQFEAALVGRLFYLGKLLVQLFQEDPRKFECCNEFLNDLDKIVTGDDFQVHTRSAKPEKASEIYVSTYHLIHMVNHLRRHLPTAGYFRTLYVIIGDRLPWNVGASRWS